ncbi:MAG: hypothetical protein PW788_13090 [Micavibrio sp.]|nr:hypothetical protein [Micavibrio sp.]
MTHRHLPLPCHYRNKQRGIILLRTLFNWLRPDDDAAQLKAVLAEVSLVPEGKALLKLARALKCPITFNSGIDRNKAGIIRLMNGKTEWSGTGGVTLRGRPRYRIDLNPRVDNAQLAVALAHELRHLWQYQTFPPQRAFGLSAGLQIAYTRMVEGDAFAFQDYFTQRLAETKSGAATAAFDWNAAFQRFQTCAISTQYDREKAEQYARLLAGAKKIFKAGAANRDARKKALSAVFNKFAGTDLAGLENILKAGVSADAPAYRRYTSEGRMVAEMRGFADARPHAATKAIDRALRTGKMPKAL